MQQGAATMDTLSTAADRVSTASNGLAQLLPANQNAQQNDPGHD